MLNEIHMTIFMDGLLFFVLLFMKMNGYHFYYCKKPALKRLGHVFCLDLLEPIRIALS